MITGPSLGCFSGAHLLTPTPKHQSAFFHYYEDSKQKKKKVAPMSQNALPAGKPPLEGPGNDNCSLLWSVSYKPHPVPCEPREPHIFQERNPSPWRGCVLSHVTLIPVFSCRASMIPGNGRLQFSEGQLLRGRIQASTGTPFSWNPFPG